MSRILLGITVLTVLALGVLNLVYPFGPEPDEVYPMVNQRIVWTYAGK